MIRLITYCLLFFIGTNSYSGELKDLFEDAELDALAFISWEYRDDPDTDVSNLFRIRRGYLTIRQEVTDNIDFRMTLDVYDDDDGVEERLKYIYGKYTLPDWGFATNHNIRMGMIATPFLDFEQSINRYRMQGHMFSEWADIYNSADLGISYSMNFGGRVDSTFRENVNSKNDGKYGSITIGAFNGPGYHDFELNSNKVIEGRISFRPFSESLTGLQFTAFGLTGKGNPNPVSKTSPAWQTYIGMISYEQADFRATAQYMSGKGNSTGEFSDVFGNALDNEGWSVFAEYVFKRRIHGIARYDVFQQNMDSPESKRLKAMAGIAYDLTESNFLLFDVEHTDFFLAEEPVTTYKFTLQLKV